MSHFSPEADLLIAALQPLPIAVVITDASGMVCSVNAALTSLTGFTAEEAVGQPLTVLSFGTGECDFFDIIREGVRSGEPWRGEWSYRRKNGDPLKGRTDPDIDQVPERRDACSDNNPAHRRTPRNGEGPRTEAGPARGGRGNTGRGNVGLEQLHRSDRRVIRVVETSWSRAARHLPDLGSFRLRPAS